MDIADIANQRMEEFNLRAVASTLLLVPRQSPPGTGTPRGHCLDCRSPIPTERKQAVPGCTLCVECADRNERRSALFASRSDRQQNELSNTEQNLENYF